MYSHPLPVLPPSLPHICRSSFTSTQENRRRTLICSVLQRMVAANLWGIPLGMFYVYKGLRKTSTMQLPALHVLVLAVCACVLANTLVLLQKPFLLGWDGAAGEKGSRTQLGLGGSGGTGLVVQEQKAWRKAEG